MSDQAKRTNLLDLTPDQARDTLAAFFAEIGAPSYRTAQVIRRLWVNPARTFGEMKELPATLPESLEAPFDLPRLALATEQTSSDGTRKFLFRLHDNEAIETVAIPE